MIVVHDMQGLGEAIRKRRRELGYTQAFLAEYPDLLIQDKILAGKTFYQVLSKNNKNR